MSTLEQNNIGYLNPSNLKFLWAVNIVTNKAPYSNLQGQFSSLNVLSLWISTLSNIKVSSIFSVCAVPIGSYDFYFLRLFGDYLFASYLSKKARLLYELGNYGLVELTGNLIASITLCNLV